MFRTYKTKIQNTNVLNQTENSLNTYDYFESFATEFGKIERKLFVDMYLRKKESNPLKVLYCAMYNLTSRQYNSIKKQLDGRVKACLEVRKTHIEEIQEKIKKTTYKIEKKTEQKEKLHLVILAMNGKENNFQKRVNRYRKLRFEIHQQKRKHHRFLQKLNRLEKDEKEKRIRICFGSKEWFHKQFHLEENGLTKEEWKQTWQQRRASQFTCIGSKDENNGNQTCFYDNDNSLRIRLNKEYEEAYGKYLIIPFVSFAYGQKEIDVAKVGAIGYTKGKGNEVTYYRAVTWRFIREDDTWYALATVDVDDAKIITINGNGCIGIDFNVNFLAVTETDRFGNPIHSFTIPFKGYDVSSGVAKQSLSHALKKVVLYSVEKKKPIAYEGLDFKKKKASLKEENKKQARMLSGFAYNLYKTILTDKCRRAGVVCTEVNPAYSSQIGHVKFMKRYGLNSHCSAACVIARRGMGIQLEKLPNTCPLGYPKQLKRQVERKKQWMSATKHWKRFTFSQKMMLLKKIG